MWQESQVLLRGEAGSGGCGGCGDSRFPVWLPMSLVARCVPGAINNWSAVPGSAAGSVCETMLDAWVGRVGWMGLSVESVLSSLLRLFLSFFFLSFLLHMRRSYVFICLSTGTVAMRSRPRGVCRVDVRAMVLCFCTRASFFSVFLFLFLSLLFPLLFLPLLLFSSSLSLSLSVSPFGPLPWL